MDHSFEEIRQVALDILAGREQTAYEPNQYRHFSIGVSEVLARRENKDTLDHRRNIVELSSHDKAIFLEVFWDLFRQGIITLGLNDSNPEFPWFHVSEYGNKLLQGQNIYFYHNTETYEKLILSEIPHIDNVTMVYLKEAMQAFMSNCILSASVMLGVATEHTFLKLLETIEANPVHQTTYANVFSEKTILQKFNKFRNILDQNMKPLPSDVKEDIDTNFAGILSMIRNFRNSAGHPTGKIISREQCYVLLNLFIPCCRKMYQLINYFK